VLLCVSIAGFCAAEWDDVLDALDAVSPLVDDVRPGLAFVDMRGIAGNPQRWMAQARAALLPFALPLRLGVGPNKMCARAAAYIADGTICDTDSKSAMLAPLALSVLEIEPDTIERLRLLGVDRLGDLAKLPHGPFVRRFGPAAKCWHQWARGEDSTPFVPRGHAVAIEASAFGDGCVEDETQVVFALRILLARICSDLERCGKRAGSLRLDVELEDAHTQSFEVFLASSTAQERAMLDVVRAKLEGVTFPAPIVGLRVRAAQLEEGGDSTGLFANEDVDAQAIAVAIARIEAALGETVRQARTREAHALEERFSYERFEIAKKSFDCAPFGRSVQGDKEKVVPQLRLLAVTEVDVGVRGGEPVCVLDRAVVQYSGPWRVEIGWFEAPVVRDEYDVLLETGDLYRIYHQGAHWYLRGAYD